MQELTPEQVEELMDDELSLDEIDAIMSEPEPAPRTRRQKKDPTADRTITGWIKLIHNFQNECEVPLHDEESRPRNKGAHYQINGVWVCRVCYLAELDKVT